MDKDYTSNSLKAAGDRISTSKRRLSRNNENAELINESKPANDSIDKSTRRTLRCKDSRLKYRSYLRAKIPERSLPVEVYDTRIKDMSQAKRERSCSKGIGEKDENYQTNYETRPLSLFENNNDLLPMFQSQDVHEDEDLYDIDNKPKGYKNEESATEAKVEADSDSTSQLRKTDNYSFAKILHSISLRTPLSKKYEINQASTSNTILQLPRSNDIKYTQLNKSESVVASVADKRLLDQFKRLEEWRKYDKEETEELQSDKEKTLRSSMNNLIKTVDKKNRDQRTLKHSHKSAINKEEINNVLKWDMDESDYFSQLSNNIIKLRDTLTNLQNHKRQLMKRQEKIGRSVEDRIRSRRKRTLSLHAISKPLSNEDYSNDHVENDNDQCRDSIHFGNVTSPLRDKSIDPVKGKSSSNITNKVTRKEDRISTEKHRKVKSDPLITPDGTTSRISPTPSPFTTTDQNSSSKLMHKLTSPSRRRTRSMNEAFSSMNIDINNDRSIKNDFYVDNYVSTGLGVDYIPTNVQRKLNNHTIIHSGDHNKKEENIYNKSLVRLQKDDTRELDNHFIEEEIDEDSSHNEALNKNSLSYGNEKDQLELDNIQTISKEIDALIRETKLNIVQLEEQRKNEMYNQKAIAEGKSKISQEQLLNGDIQEKFKKFDQKHTPETTKDANYEKKEMIEGTTKTKKVRFADSRDNFGTTDDRTQKSHRHKANFIHPKSQNLTKFGKDGLIKGSKTEKIKEHSFLSTQKVQEMNEEETAMEKEGRTNDKNWRLVNSIDNLSTSTLEKFESAIDPNVYQNKKMKFGKLKPKLIVDDEVYKQYFKLSKHARIILLREILNKGKIDTFVAICMKMNTIMLKADATVKKYVAINAEYLSIDSEETELEVYKNMKMKTIESFLFEDEEVMVSVSCLLPHLHIHYLPTVCQWLQMQLDNPKSLENKRTLIKENIISKLLERMKSIQKSDTQYNPQNIKTNIVGILMKLFFE